MVSCIPSASRVLMLLSQLERLNEDHKVSNNDAIRQITGKILHLLQTQGDLTHQTCGIITFTHAQENQDLVQIKLLQVSNLLVQNSENRNVVLMIYKVT